MSRALLYLVLISTTACMAILPLEEQTDHTAGASGDAGSAGTSGGGNAGMGGTSGGGTGGGGTGGGGTGGTSGTSGTGGGGTGGTQDDNGGGGNGGMSGCLSGYDDVNGDGTSCVDFDECITDNGGCGDAMYYTCTNNVGADPTCADKNECDTDNGGCDATYYTCMNNVGADPTCVDIDECATNNGGCGDATDYTCTNNVGAAPTCDDNECSDGAVAACGMGATACDNTPGSYSCTCGSGYSGTGTTACSDIDECSGGAVAACGTGATACDNTPGSYSCTCGGGYSGTETTACNDIDECSGGAVAACGMGATACNNTAGSYSCTCGSGYSGTGTTACSDINACLGTPVCTADYPCQDLPAPSLNYTCRGQFADWTPKDSPTTFTDNGDGTVTDSRKGNGLVWQQTVDAGSYTWADAKTYCEGLSLVGAGWRLPTRAELESIVNFGTRNPAIDATLSFSPNTLLAPFFFWSSSAYVKASNAAWGVYFVDGGSNIKDVDSKFYVRCVRSNASVIASAGSGGAPPGRYTCALNGDTVACTDMVNVADTVYDTLTKLTWQRTVPATPTAAGCSGATCTQAGALDYCAGLSLGGNNNWRLPQISELLTLVDPTQSNPKPAIDATAFPNTLLATPPWFWSSSAYFGPPGGNAWNVYFDDGPSYVDSVTGGTGRVRCVR